MNRFLLSLLIVFVARTSPLCAQDDADSVQMAWKAVQNRDGRLLAVCYGHWSEAGRVVIFDAKTGTERNRLPSMRGVRALLPTPDGTQFVTGSTHGEYRVVDFETGKVLKQWRQADGTVEGLAFSRDGKFLIAGSHSQCINVYDFESAKRVTQFKGFKDIVYSVAMSPDGKWLASSDSSGEIVIMSFPDGEMRHRVNHGELKKARRPASTGLVWSSDGGKLFSGGFDETICVIDAESGKVLKQSEPHGRIDSLLKTDDDRFLFTCDRTGLHRFDAMTLELVPFPEDPSNKGLVKPHGSLVTGLNWGSAENQIISASWDNEARIWDATTGRCLQVFKPKKMPTKRRTAPIAKRHLIADGIRFVTYSPDGSSIYAFTMNGQRHTLDPATLKSQSRPRGLVDSIGQGTSSADGSRIFLTSFEARLFSVDPNRWQAKRFARTGSYSALSSVGQSPANNLVVVGKDNGHVAAIDTTNNDLRWEAKLAELPIASLSCSPDGKFVLATSGDYRKYKKPGAAWLLSPKDGSIVKHIKDHSAKVNVSAFVSGGRYFCSGSSDSRVLTYDTQDLDKKPIETTFPAGPDQICELKDGVCAVSYWGGGVAICDLKSGTIVKQLAGHPRTEPAVVIRSLALSPDGKNLVSADLAGDMFLWPVEDFTQSGDRAE